MEEGGNESCELAEHKLQLDKPNTDTQSGDNCDVDEDTPNNTKQENEEKSTIKASPTGEKKEEKNPEEKLCGWLHHRARGIGNLKVTRLRWFIYGQENCKLYYYRETHDLLPLGEINIATASFYFDAGNTDKPGLFQVKSDGKDFFLDAGNRHNMMYWLQALQSKRREYNLSRVAVSTERVGQWSLNRTSQFGGLISDSPSTSRKVLDPKTAGVDNFPQIHLTVSEPDNSSSSLTVTSSPKTSSIRTLNNLKLEIQHALSGIKIPGKNTKESVFYCDIPCEADQMSNSTTSINSDDSEQKSIQQNSVPVDSTKDMTGSQLSPLVSSGVSETVIRDERSSSDASAVRQTMKNTNNQNVQRKTGSWAVIDKQDVVDYDDRAERKDSFNEKVQGQTENETVRQGKFMSTLKKIRLGKRQVSEPGTIRKTLSDPGPICPKCKTPLPVTTKTGTDVSSGASSGKNVGDLEEELQANRDIISILQKRLDELGQELESRLQVNDKDDEERTGMLVERDKQVTELQRTIAHMTEESKITTEKLRLTEAELNTSQEQEAMYLDMLTIKNETIESLTNQIFDHEHAIKERQLSGSFDQPDVVQANKSGRESTSSLKSDKADEKEMERMKDMCQGYELQHKFLTKEILELNELRKFDVSREKKLMMDYAKLQAKYYQVKSKYYVLLKQQKEQGPVKDGEEGQEVVNQLLQDAMETDIDDVELHLTGSGPQYDKYGFSRKHYMDETEGPPEEDPLGNKAAELERQGEELSTRVKEADHNASLMVKWENYMVGRGGKLQRSQELKLLIRQGVPHEYREEVWLGLHMAHPVLLVEEDLRMNLSRTTVLPQVTGKLSHSKVFGATRTRTYNLSSERCIQFYVADERFEKGANYYQTLLQRKAAATGSDPSVKQIELDLLRTLPSNKHYDSIEADGVIKLRKVLLAFSEYNKVIGYCQGLNRLAAIALLFLNEEDAFWCLVAIVDHILPPEYFSTTLMAAQADQRVLKDLVQEKIPKIHQTLETNGVDLSLFTFNWFLTIFVDNIPTETFLRIWDTFLYEGSKVLFRFAVAFLKMNENEILQQKGGLQLNRLLRRVGEKMTNVKLIAWYAFTWINPFPMRFLANRRQQHLQDIKVELSELDKLRHGMKMTREQQAEQDDFFSDDDLDS